MAIDHFKMCIERLPGILSNTQEGNSRYIFAVDQPNTAEALIGWGYNAIYISSMQELNNVIEVLEAANMFSNNCVTIGCCNKSVNDSISRAIGQTRYINTGWQLYDKDHSKAYYELHIDDFKPVVERFIKRLEKAEPEEDTAPRKSKSIDYKATALEAIEKFDIVKIDGVLKYNKTGRVYNTYTEAVNDDLLIRLLHNSKKNARSEVFPYIRHFAPEKELTRDKVAFLNGAFDFKKGILTDFTDDMYFLSEIPHNYNENAFNDMAAAKIADDFFNNISCNDFEVQQLLYDIIACTIHKGRRL